MNRPFHILAQARSIGLLTLTSSLLGLVRELAIAHEFGATKSTDSYLVALSIPTTLYGLLLGSGLNFAVIPRLAHMFSTDPEGSRKTFAQFLSVLALLGALVSTLIMLFPARLIRIFAPGMASSNSTAELARILSPLFYLFVCSYSLGSFHCARNRPSSWALVGVTQNAIVVMSVLLVSKLLGFRSLILGTVAGALAAFMVQAALAHWAQFDERWSIPLPGGNAMGILRTLLPFALVLGVGGDSGTSQADMFLLRFFGSRLGSGSITLLALGNKLMGLPVVLIGSAIGLALLPSASIHLGNDDLSGATDRFVQAFGCALLLICPIAVFYMTLSSHIVFTVFHNGAITSQQLVELGKLLQAYAGATVGLTLVYVLSSFLGALRQTRALIGTAIVTVFLNALLMRYMAGRSCAVGIATAISIGSGLYCLALLFLLTRRLGLGVLMRLLQSALLISAGALVMQYAIRIAQGLDLFVSVPWLGRILIPAVVALMPYAAWVMWHRKRIALTVIQ